MGTGQTLLVLGAMILLGMIALSVNRTIVDSDAWVTESQFTVVATNVAQQFMEEALGKRFDEREIPAQFTPIVNLGPEPGEVIRAQFDDVDDYQGYIDMVSTPLGGFSVDVGVCYVQPSNPDRAASVITCHKKVTVTVTSDYFEGEIKMHQIFSYRGELI